MQTEGERAEPGKGSSLVVVLRVHREEEPGGSQGQTDYLRMQLVNC